jgi:acetylornithine deacetylase/succinyl-diaminopimelate desuccinylase-like protein
LADDLWRLVHVHSPTRQEREIAFVFADMLRDAGAEVEIDETLPESPNVIGRLFGKSPGRVLQLAGHLDHIDVPHPAPERNEEIISGRGSADMKGGLAGILEIVRIFKESGCDFPGQLLITTYGLHEAPLGVAEGLLNMIEGKIHGDAAIVFEGARDQAIIMGKGQSIWNIDLIRDGDVCHELKRRPEADNLLETMNRVVKQLTEKNAGFTGEKHDFPLLGPQSVFVGQIHYGDFYNRAPKQAFLQGTWRWHPDRTFKDVQKELKDLLAEVLCPKNIKIEDYWTFVGEGFSFDPEEDIVKCLREAYAKMNGKTMELSGSSSINDVNRIVPFARIPAVAVSLDGERAHADYEFTRLDRMRLGCCVALQTVINYFGR